MCGRSRCTLAPERVVRAASSYGANPQGTPNWVDQERYQPGHNLTPGSWTPVLLHRPLSPTNPQQQEQQPDDIEIHTMRWGLVPSFTKPNEKPDPWRMFNARSESITEKPSFRRLVPTRRCLVLLDGFYEWKAEGKGGKQPYYIYLEDSEEPMICAGLYDTWIGPNDEKLFTYTILTTDSSKKLEWLHDRMPVILKDKAAQELWLDVNNPSSVHKLHTILAPYNGDDLKWHYVTKSMSNPAFQGPQCSEPLKKPSVKAFFQPRSSIAGDVATERKMEEKEQCTQPPVVNPDEKPCRTTPSDAQDNKPKRNLIGNIQGKGENKGNKTTVEEIDLTKQEEEHIPSSAGLANKTIENPKVVQGEEAIHDVKSSPETSAKKRKADNGQDKEPTSAQKKKRAPKLVAGQQNLMSFLSPPKKD